MSERTARVIALVEWIKKRGGRVSVRQIQRNNQRLWKTKSEVLEALKSLERAGIGAFEALTKNRTRIFVLAQSSLENEADEEPPLSPLDEAMVDAWLQGYAAGWSLKTKPNREDLLALFRRESERARIRTERVAAGLPARPDEES